MAELASPGACLLCGHRPLRLHGLFTGASRALHAAQWECPSCRLLCSHPQASAAEIASYYSDDYYGRIWTDPDAVWRQNLVAYETEMRLFDRLLPAPTGGLALDVGCGYGLLIHLLNQRGYRAMGCETGKAALAFCRARGLRAVRAMAPHLPYPDSTFDLVVSFHVIEHVSDPPAFVNSLVRVLRPGGAVVVVTDHRWTTLSRVQRLVARLRGQTPAFYTSTDHTFVFAREHVAGLMRAAGCSTIETAAFTHVPPGESAHWRAYKGFFRTLDRVRGWGDYMLIVGRKPPIAAVGAA